MEDDFYEVKKKDKGKGKKGKEEGEQEPKPKKEKKEKVVKDEGDQDKKGKKKEKNKKRDKKEDIEDQKPEVDINQFITGDFNDNEDNDNRKNKRKNKKKDNKKQGGKKGEQKKTDDPVDENSSEEEDPEEKKLQQRREELKLEQQRKEQKKKERKEKKKQQRKQQKEENESDDGEGEDNNDEDDDKEKPSKKDKKKEAKEPKEGKEGEGDQEDEEEKKGNESDDYEYDPVEVAYCEFCTVPHEFCSFFSQDLQACKDALKKENNKLYGIVYEGRKDEVEAEAKNKKKVNKNIKPAEKVTGDTEVRVLKQKRGGKKTTTTVYGLANSGINLKEFSKKLGKKFACGNALIIDEESGEQVVQLLGDIDEELLMKSIENDYPELLKAKFNFVEGGNKKGRKKK